jgi:hypothetical protein
VVRVVSAQRKNCGANRARAAGMGYRAGLGDRAQVVGLKEGHHVHQRVEGHEQEGTRPIAPAFDELRHGHVARRPRHLTSRNEASISLRL